jgi:hypothetical protein
VGVVRVGALNDPEGETLVLVNVLQLNDALLAEANEHALRLEARAYEIDPVYARTPPMEPAP